MRKQIATYCTSTRCSEPLWSSQSLYYHATKLSSLRLYYSHKPTCSKYVRTSTQILVPSDKTPPFWDEIAFKWPVVVSNAIYHSSLSHHSIKSMHIVNILKFVSLRLKRNVVQTAYHNTYKQIINIHIVRQYNLIYFYIIEMILATVPVNALLSPYHYCSLNC
jgi:hypothetical protein